MSEQPGLPEFNVPARSRLRDLERRGYKAVGIAYARTSDGSMAVVTHRGKVVDGKGQPALLAQFSTAELEAELERRKALTASTHKGTPNARH